MPLHLTEDEVRRTLDADRLLAAIESAFRDRYPSVTIPPRVHISLANGIFLVMPCYDRLAGTVGMKLVSVRSNLAPHQEPVQARYFLIDPECAEPRLSVAANHLTDFRTAATSALATKFLAREDTSTLAIFGTGRLARAHLAILPRVRKFQRVLICGRNPQRSSDFVNRITSHGTSLNITAENPRTCAAEADVICTCTTSPAPLFDGRDLRPGTHLNLVGAFQPHTREVDTYTIKAARVVVDTYDAAQAEAGDIVIPMQEGAIPHDHIAADLHELFSGKKQGRRSREQITVFKSVGCALEDLVAAELLLAQH